ncbi:MAG: DUF5908 family protein [Bacteroidota bacterium]
MAVEIKELVIRAVVEYEAQNPSVGAAGKKGERKMRGMSEEEKADLIQACVQQVLKVLKKKKHR